MKYSIERPLVLIPGFMLDESLWDETIDYFPSETIFHRASLSQGESIEEIAANIAFNSPPEFILVGFSLGGYIARYIAEKFPNRVSALILIATSLRTDTILQRQLKEAAVKVSAQGQFRGLSSASIAKSLHPQKSNDTEVINRIRKMGVRLGYETFARQSMLTRESSNSQTIQCPTLIIAGAQDALRLPEETQELCNEFSTAHLKIIEESGHMIPIEQPEELAKTIKCWINSIEEPE